MAGSECVNIIAGGTYGYHQALNGKVKQMFGEANDAFHKNKLLILICFVKS